jgi:hypothetical protein
MVCSFIVVGVVTTSPARHFYFAGGVEGRLIQFDSCFWITLVEA